MKTSSWQSFQFLLLTLVILLGSSCQSFAISRPSISNTIICTSLNSDNSPKDIPAFFYVDSPSIYCTIEMKGAQAATDISARWIYGKDQQASTGELIFEEIKQCNNGYIAFALPTPAEGFDAGEYSVSLSTPDGEKTSTAFSISRKTEIPLPHIQQFSVDRTTITSGEQATISWQVTGANRVNIEPGIGNVQSSGSMAVNPQTDAGYTIYALNENGCSLGSLLLKVKPAVTEKPDLVISDFWVSGNVISYRIKNIGTAPSCQTQSYFYRLNKHESTDYVAPLDPGEERVEQFAQYHFSLRYPAAMGASTDEVGSDVINILICANATNSCPEIDTGNNCKEHNFGALSSFDMYKKAVTAVWSSSAGNLQWPMYPVGNSGYVVTSQIQTQPSGVGGNSLLMSPPLTSKGWIQGVYGDKSTEYPYKLNPRVLHHLSKFTAKVGLANNAPADASVKFRFGIMRGEDVQYFPDMIITPADGFKLYEVDLKEYADQQVFYVLRVESNIPLQRGCAAWVDPLISQTR